MSLHRPVLCGLALLLVLPLIGASPAEAAFIRRAKVKEVVDTVRHTSSYRVVATTAGDDTAPVSLEARVTSDEGGEEDMTLVESDAWLHGAAAIAALPAIDAELSLTLYDTASTELLSYSGRLATDGTVTLVADATKTESGDCTSRTGCSEAVAPDVELLAAEVFAAASGYEITFDLAGADAYEVAYATVSMTVRDEVTTCDKVTRECTTTGEVSTTRAEVGWDAIGAVWEGDLTLDHAGLVEVRLTERDAAGVKVRSDKFKSGLPWTDADDGDGVATSTVDEDPLTRIGFLYGREGARVRSVRTHRSAELSVVSDGWAVGASLPVDAEFTLASGDVVTIPVNSYQRVQAEDTPLSTEWQAVAAAYARIDPGSTISISGGNFNVDDWSYFSASDSTCTVNGCLKLEEDDAGALQLIVTAYAEDASDLPDEDELVVSLLGSDGVEVMSEAVTVVFADELSAVFATEVEFAADPLGLDVSGKLKLLGAPNRKGKQSTLSKGSFYASFERDPDGEVELAAGDKDNVGVAARFTAGEPVGLVDAEGAAVAPPLLNYRPPISGIRVTRTVVTSIRLR